MWILHGYKTPLGSLHVQYKTLVQVHTNQFSIFQNNISVYAYNE